MKTSRSYVNEGAVGEIDEVCPNGHYTYEFAYGASRYFIFDTEYIGFHYLDTTEEANLKNDLINKAIADAKEEFGTKN